MNVGDVVSGRVDSIQKTHLIVNLKEGWKGLLHVSAVSDYYVTSIKSMFKVGERYWFSIEKIDEEKRRVKLSWKTLMPRFVRDPFDFDIKETEAGFTNLYNKTLEESKND